MRRGWVLPIAILQASVLLAGLSGCAKLMGNIRKDLDDTEYYDNRPVVGGRWTEKGFLDESMPEYGSGLGTYGAVGHNERSPASAIPDPREADGKSWVSPEQADQARRDAQRAQFEGAFNTNQVPVLEPPVKRVYKNGIRATRADFVDESQNEGSLWASNGQTNYFFTKNKVRGVGDIITVTVEADLARDVGLEVKRTLTQREKEIELAKAQDRLRAKHLGLPDPDKPADGKDAVASTQAAPARTPAAAGAAPAPGSPAAIKAEEEANRLKEKEETVPLANYSDIDVGRALEIKATDVMMGEILERYPNGNYKIRATKKVLYKNGFSRLVTLIGVARGQDISEDDVVGSSKLYEYRLQAIY